MQVKSLNLLGVDLSGNNCYKQSLIQSNLMELNNDQQLVENAKADKADFVHLYDKYHDRIYAYVIRRVQNEDAAQDVVSQTFFDALNHIDRYEYRGLPFVAWLYKIAHNNVLKHIKKYSMQNMVEIDQVRDLHKDEKVEDIVKGNENAQKIRVAMEQLDHEEKEIIRLKYFEDASNIEISEIMGITANNAGVKLYRALKRLKTLLNTYE